MSSEVADYRAQAEREFKAFEQEFGRFEQFRPVTGAEALTLQEAEALLRELVEVRNRYAGRKSKLSSLRKMIGRISEQSERQEFGQYMLGIQVGVDTRLAEVERTLEAHINAKRVERERIDVTLPGRRPRRGHQHPVTVVRQRIEDIFVALGYTIEDGPEIETDFYNFDALNIPPSHPARSPQDTFYTSEGYALRSQTSNVQIHAMERRRPPLRAIAPGKVFRRDTPDATHNPMFFQFEGILVDHNITMGHLKGTVTEFLRHLYGPRTRTRFRPSYFPFTEPSAEFDFSCFKCDGAGCALCKGGGWIELGGSGMIHPNVLRAVNIDPAEFSGFAFGFGIDRMCMMNFGLDDIRLLFENDVRFLEQFN